MSPPFNLITEPWIPVIGRDGQPAMLGLAETLARAHELREVSDPSPLVTAALHRLLLAVLHRIFGPPGQREWLALWQRGQFDAAPLDEYFARWGERFDLFHPTRPFYQSTDPELATAEPHPVAKLAHELASGNNDTLFDHSRSDQPRPVPPGEAARLVVAMQAYALGGGVSKPFNLCHAPLLQGALVLLRGETLGQTLLLNLVVRQGDQPMPARADDAPWWELDRVADPQKRSPRGYLDYLTWPSRRLALVRCEAGWVERVRLLQGDALAAEGLFDPMMALSCRDPKKGFLPLRLQEERAAWRDSHTLLAEWGEVERRPLTIEQLARLARLAPELRQTRLGLDVIGLCSDQAKVNFWRHERLPLPLAYLDDPAHAGQLQLALGWGEAVGKALRFALRTLARHLLVPLEDSQRDPDKDAVSALADSFASLRHYWAALESAFHDLYLHLPADPAAAQTRWCAVLRRASWQALALATDSLDGSARALKAAVRARASFAAALQDEKTLPQTEKEVTVHAE